MRSRFYLSARVVADTISWEFEYNVTGFMCSFPVEKFRTERLHFAASEAVFNVAHNVLEQTHLSKCPRFCHAWTANGRG